MSCIVMGMYCSFSAETQQLICEHMSFRRSSALRASSLHHTWKTHRPRAKKHMPELSVYYVAGGKMDQLLREDTSDMIWILKIYQRANKTHGFLQILCWEMCVKPPERCFIQEGQGARRRFDMMQEYFYFVFCCSFIKQKYRGGWGWIADVNRTLGK